MLVEALKSFISKCNKINNERDFREKFGILGKEEELLFEFYLSRVAMQMHMPEYLWKIYYYRQNHRH